MTSSLRTVLALCLIFLPAALRANSYVGRGTIVTVVDNGKGGSSILVRNEFSTPRDAEDDLSRWDVKGDAVIFLDDQPADRGALQPGRLVILCSDAQVFRVYSSSFVLPGVGGASDWWTVQLQAALVPGAAGAAGDEKERPSDLIIHLAVADGAVQQAVALTPGWGPSYGASAAWHELDARQLRIAGGRVSGECTLRLEDRGRALGEHRVTLDVAAGGDGKATIDGKDAAVKRAEQRPAAAIPDDWYLFLRAPDPGDLRDKRHQCLRLELRRQGGAIHESSFSYGYGKPGAGAAADKANATIADGRATLQAARGDTAYEFTGVVIGDRVFGTYHRTQAGASYDGRFSAYIREVHAPSIGWGEGDARNLRGSKQ